MKKYLKFLSDVIDTELRFVFREGSSYEVTWENESCYKIRGKYAFGKQDEGSIYKIIEK